ncbi:FAD-dependent oxidoreductase [Nocardia sp. X0981]
MPKPTADVLIVGAGPVGLTAAVVLEQLGHGVVIVDDQREGANTSRAAVVHPRTLELLEPYGVTHALVDRGVHTPTFTIRDRDQLLVRVPFDTLPTRYPYTLMISQADTEKFLVERLSELGGKVVRPAVVSEISQDEDAVTATFDDNAQIRARYLLGADGMHSTVRTQAGITFSGETYAESFTLADVRLSGGVPQGEVILYFSPAGLVVVAPLPDDMYRIVATVDEAPHDPNVTFVQRLLDERGPQAFPAKVERVVWGSRFRVHHRVADSFRSGRILLAGDAGHIHSPAGGQGMNLGIEDAVTTAETLSKILNGAPDVLLDEHATGRREAAEEVVAIARRLTDMATASARVRPVRNAGMRIAGKVPAVQQRIAWRLSGLERR